MPSTICGTVILYKPKRKYKSQFSADSHSGMLASKLDASYSKTSNYQAPRVKMKKKKTKMISICRTAIPYKPMRKYKSQTAKLDAS